MRAINKKELYRGAAELAIIALFAYVSFRSMGYDDEFFNIRKVEAFHGYRQLIRHINSIDVHPPGMYVVNKFLYDFLGSWNLTRLFSGLFTSITLVALWRATRPTSPISQVFSFVAICLNPAELLWCTGLRWQAYVVALTNVLLILILKNTADQRTFWVSFYALSTAIFYLSYIALVVTPVALIIGLLRRKATIRNEIGTIIIGGVITFIIWVPQLYYFVMVHSQNTAKQRGSVIATLIGAVLHVFFNQGAMPLTVAGISIMLANVLLGFFALKSLRRLAAEPAPQFFVLGTLSAIVTRIAAKYRNLVVFSSAQGVSQLNVFETIRIAPVRFAVLGFLTLGYLLGTVNVATHSGTTKGSWNTPYRLVLSRIDDMSEGCNKATVVTFDQVIAYYVRRDHGDLVSVRDDNWMGQIPGTSDCLIVARTNRGSISDEQSEQFETLLEDYAPSIRMTENIGYDRDAAFKRRIEPNVPDYYVTLYLIDVQ